MSRSSSSSTPSQTKSSSHLRLQPDLTWTTPSFPPDAVTAHAVPVAVAAALAPLAPEYVLADPMTGECEAAGLVSAPTLGMDECARCEGCRSYMTPWSSFSAARAHRGRWRCALCTAWNDPATPVLAARYATPASQSKQPELASAVVDYVDMDLDALTDAGEVDLAASLTTALAVIYLVDVTADAETLAHVQASLLGGLEGLPSGAHVGLIALDGCRMGLAAVTHDTAELPVFRWVETCAGDDAVPLIDVVDWPWLVAEKASSYETLAAALSGLGPAPAPALAAATERAPDLAGAFAAVLDLVEASPTSEHYTVAVNVVLASSARDVASGGYEALGARAAELGVAVSVYGLRLFNGPIGLGAVAGLATASGGALGVYDLPMGAGSGASSELPQDLFLAGRAESRGHILHDAQVVVRLSTGLRTRLVSGPCTADELVASRVSTGAVRVHTGLVVELEYESASAKLPALPIVQLAVRGLVYSPSAKRMVPVVRVVSARPASLATSPWDVLAAMAVAPVAKVLALSALGAEHSADAVAQVIGGMVTDIERLVPNVAVGSGGLLQRLAEVGAPQLAHVLRVAHALCVRSANRDSLGDGGVRDAAAWILGDARAVLAGLYPVLVAWESEEVVGRRGVLPLSRRAVMDATTRGAQFVVADGGHNVVVYGSSGVPAVGSALRSRYTGAKIASALGVRARVVITSAGGVGSDALEHVLVEEGVVGFVDPLESWVEGFRR
ncbi:uncharacterized protein AMSG_07503 [Thecamonas trahens ATCC 50062]|uniref:Protein transport protein SEC23 n=1 Tax=Thecamonas trahens ATCC 50062 TaxID=461836 RepID=A0A0L0DHC6_THETB|nr:hypothetical protein AMSG_07503 [Thecamonas trahens ATCC 50062]KNC51595.1 hypothetical protein AMSG_07503 [Thecamonas trahens ATCC 50062]|eukprot:XP_013755993.1 hypothetical protein AMSG_07503 [Thecamonas trahens ATCC 50062]